MQLAPNNIASTSAGETQQHNGPADSIVNRQFLKNLPNWLTFVRLGLIPIFVILMQDPSRSMVLLAAGVFCVAALTDYLDGIIARKFGAVSEFGKLLDPLVDKVLVISALVMLVAQRGDVDGAPWVPGWMVVLVLAREIWVTGLRGVAASRGMIMAANTTGKVKSLLQMVAIVCLLLHDLRLPFRNFGLTFQFLGLVLLFTSILFSYWGAIEYTHAVFLEEKSKR